MAKYLIVVAHPDDEVLGAGGTIYKLGKSDNTFDVAYLCANVQARAGRPNDKQLEEDIIKSTKLLKINNVYKGTFPNIKINTTPHLEVVQFIEQTIISSEPDIIITHHPADTNNDHYQTSVACQEAIRLFQRRSDIKPISEVWYMEVPSSTEWDINSSIHKYNPNLFVEIEKAGVEQKIAALNAYSGVMRAYPHPRSVENLSALATYRGAQAGLMYAEAFECVFRRITQ